MMERPQKVFLERDEGVDTAIAKIKEFPGKSLSVNLPRNSVFGASPDTFVSLRDAAEGMGKTLIIESVDDHVLELAGLAGFQAWNPVLRFRERTVSDIVPRKRAVRKREMPPSPRTKEKPSPPTPRLVPAEPAKKPSLKKKEPPVAFLTPPPRTPRIDEGVPPEERPETPAHKPHVRRARRGFLIATIALVVLVGGGAVALVVLPKAKIALVMKKVPVDFSETVVVTADPASQNSAGAIVVPGEALEARTNLSLPFTAAATETVSAKATGKLVVYNAYSSTPQRLVQNTRFESPDKKIFRLTREVTVPGAKVEGGRKVPAFAEVTVVAEEAGEAYNLPPSSGWRIPGFQGKPQYEGFYAETKEGMKGGFVGERAKPSAAEIANARVKLTEALTDALESQLLIVLSDRFTTLPGSRRFMLASEDMSADPEDSHTFHLFGEATMEQIVFEEPTLKSALVAKVSAKLPGELVVKDFSFKLGTTTVDFVKNTLTFLARGEGVFTEPFDADAFRAAVAGKREEELKAAVFALPSVESATITLTPFFARSVPTNLGNIEVTVE